MVRKIAVALCMGSSCFARGNRIQLEMVERLIQERGWKDLVELSGQRCTDQCSEGPNVTVNGTLHQGLDECALARILEEQVRLIM